MYKEELSIFATIKGIGSASGLVLKQNLLYVISDNSAYLYEYNIANKTLDKKEILKGFKTLANIPKAEKPDFEVLCSYGDQLYIIGSGSTAKRNLMLAVDLLSHQIIKHDLTELFSKIKVQFGIDDDNLNIEGAIFTGTGWFLFNRGNGNATKNGIFKIHGKDLKSAIKIAFTPIMLLKTNKVLVTFTDAILHQEQIYFIAAAEDTTSTYQDGEIVGSYMGSINIKDLSLNFIKQISTHQKFEGITLLKQNAENIEFLLCEDRDNDVLETTIYRLVL